MTSTPTSTRTKPMTAKPTTAAEARGYQALRGHLATLKLALHDTDPLLVLDTF